MHIVVMIKCDKHLLKSSDCIFVMSDLATTHYNKNHNYPIIRTYFVQTMSEILCCHLLKKNTAITVPQSKRNITESFYLESSIRYICIYSNKYMNNIHIQRVNLLIQVHISDYKWMDTFLLLFRFIIHR